MRMPVMKSVGVFVQQSNDKVFRCLFSMVLVVYVLLSVNFTLIINDELTFTLFVLVYSRLVYFDSMICFTWHCKTCAIVIGLLKATYILPTYL